MEVRADPSAQNLAKRPMARGNRLCDVGSSQPVSFWAIKALKPLFDQPFRLLKPRLRGLSDFDEDIHGVQVGIGVPFEEILRRGKETSVCLFIDSFEGDHLDCLVGVDNQ